MDKFTKPSKDGATIGAQLDMAASHVHEIRRELASAEDQLKTVIREASALGIGEQAIADRVGVARMTVRSWIGRA